MSFFIGQLCLTKIDTKSSFLYICIRKTCTKMDYLDTISDKHNYPSAIVHKTREAEIRLPV